MKITENKNGTKRITTDTIEAIALYINTPSFEYDDKGSYNMVIAFNEDDFIEMGQVIVTEMEANKAEIIRKNPKIKNMIKEVLPFEAEMDDNGDPTGRVVMKLKQRAKIVNSDDELVDRPLPIVDCQGNDASSIKASGGSKVRVIFNLVPYYTQANKSYGLSRWIQSVQLVEPVLYKSSNGFDNIDDGYIADSLTTASPALGGEIQTPDDDIPFD